ncbi:amino acid ABC transporter permease [Arthrobacter crusticola]|uniref:Amino acid ABC transporter permease n=2 Tax=Arthrobacter crusticola TaxID=2547960 RepID=A0A4R5U0M3_9MICC|nr:amino acid ABC transporter permease [Arthrobacter crusticola]
MPFRDTAANPLKPVRSAPPPVVRLAVAAVLISVVAAVCFGIALRNLYVLTGASNLVVLAVCVVAALAGWIPLLPALRAVTRAKERTSLMRQDRIVEARHTAALGRESASTSLGYAAAVFVLAALLAFAVTNDGAIAQTFLRGSFIAEAWEDVLKAFWVNVRVAIGAEILVLILGLAIAVMRMIPGPAGRPLRILATLYADIFRAIPGIIVLYLVGFGLSLAEVPVFRDLPPIWLAIFALTLTYSAYVAEVYRAGLESIHPSQWAAARSLGLSYPMTLRTVIIPQAIRRVMPPLLNDFIGLQKDTALIGVMGVIDAFTQSRLVASSVFNLSPVTVVAIIFVLATIPQSRFVDRLVERDQARQRAGSS